MCKIGAKMKGGKMTILMCISLMLALSIGYPANATVSNAVTTRPAVFDNLSPNETSLVHIILEPSSNWEEFIAPSPTVIALLGQLMVISNKVDVNLTQYGPMGGFKRVLYPNSFRASLVQVANEGWAAFMNAHTNMDKIQLYMQQVPAEVKSVVKIFAQSSPILIEHFLPPTLNKIQEISNKCVELSAQTALKFNDVMELLGELLAASESGRGGYENRLAENQIELNVSRIEKQHYEKIGQELKREKDKIEVEIGKLRSEYDKAYNDIPTGWKAIGQRLLNAIPQVVTSIFRPNGGGGGGNGGGGFKGAAANFGKSVVASLILNLYNQIGETKTALSQFFKGKSDAFNGGKLSSMVQAYRVVLDKFDNVIKKYPQNDLSIKALGFVNKTKSMFQSFEQTFQSFPHVQINETEQQQIVGNFEDLQNEMKEVVAQSEKIMENGAASGGSQEESGGQGSGGGDFDKVGGSERFKAQLKLAQLRNAEARYDQYFGEMTKYHDEMKVLMGKIAMLNLREVNFKEIIELLKEGIKLLAKIRMQWSRLIQFFQLIAVRTEVTLNNVLVPKFVEHSKLGQRLIGVPGFGEKERQWFIGQMQSEVLEINKVAYFLYTLSSTYFEISSRYLLDRLASVSQMLAIDDKEERKRLLTSLRNEVNQTQDEIRLLAKQRRLEYTRLVDARQRELSAVITRMGGPNEADTRVIQSQYG